MQMQNAVQVPSSRLPKPNAIFQKLTITEVKIAWQAVEACENEDITSFTFDYKPEFYDLYCTYFDSRTLLNFDKIKAEDSFFDTVCSIAELDPNRHSSTVYIAAILDMICFSQMYHQFNDLFSTHSFFWFNKIIYNLSCYHCKQLSKKEELQRREEERQTLPSQSLANSVYSVLQSFCG